jgi:uncharacterized membrane protein
LLTTLVRRITARANDRGAVMIIAVGAVVMAIAAAALGVDLGRVELEKRTDQNVADLAALDAARAVGFILNTTNQAGYNTAAQSAAVASAARNGFSGAGKTVTATVGSLDANNAFTATGTSAVKVVTASSIKYAFHPGSKALTATGVALVGSPIAAFSVGSTLASLDTSKSQLDPMLRTWLGSGSLSAVSYNGLAGSNLSLSALQTALLAQGMSVGTTQQLLDQQLTLAQLFTATASALTTQGKNVAAAEVQDIINASITNSTKVKLSDLLDVATPSDSAALAAEFNVYQLVTGSAQVANGSSFVSVPLTGINLLGLTGVSLSASVISPAQTGIGPVGTTASNAQVALKVTVNVGLGALLPVVNVTLTYTAANAQGTLTSIVCGASPSIAVSDYAAGVTVSGIGATILGDMNVSSSVAQTAASTLTFSHPTEFSPTYLGKHVGASTAGVSLASVSVTGTGATAALQPLLQAALPTTLSTLDTALQPVIRPLLRGLGLEVSQTDVEALGIYPSPSSCGGHPRLVQ